MRIYTCQQCSQLTYFENTSCTRCGAILAFTPDNLTLAAVESDAEGFLKPIGDVSGRRFRHCANREQHYSCNWAVAHDDPSPFCISCRLNRTIPDLSVFGNADRWRRIEGEKRRLIYSLLRLGLPVSNQHGGVALAFDFLADDVEPVYTGHKDGLITLNIAEADGAHRELTRSQMEEPYRTLLGHFRHESGHYYWQLLVENSSRLESFRHTFGDDRPDYGQALHRYYQEGPPPDWQTRYVSAYASSHPWEDWAETWAHYLHIIDTMETAHEFGLQVDPRRQSGPGLKTSVNFNPYHEADIGSIIEHWLPLTYCLNSLNRSMGHEPVYPFVLPQAAIKKLELIHQIVRSAPAR
ncbi:zinc-binding metallopeptidase family protein [Cellvibrio polysaccharolyticus]|uniref:Zinc-ribbon domain-containing protein n=1 Tax=Cellvibrio polysaccharolyticus TaxID=2082724 RepID=A0A928YV00_9GAMM|nr:putative zinc-binding metallopeptidase [Cellvibrio polysaccharolyticus]MBE8716533.1 hypothetical protein [Cellvibrio polysaccharolyticus]